MSKKKKTVLNQLMARISKNSTFSAHQKHLLRDMINDLRQTERVNIQEAYDQGVNDEHDNNNYQEYKDSSDYFTNTYEQ